MLLASLTLAAAGCRSNSRGDKAVIEFTQIPPTSPGGPDRVAYVRGRVHGVLPGQRIVLYAHAGSWWVQPLTDQPFTPVEPDGSWQNSTHLGTEYAALLVGPEYHPATTLDSLPSPGGSVIAVATATSQPLPPLEARTVHFSGYDWEARRIAGDRNGSPNTYDPANAWTDQNGFLHLRVSGTPKQWLCSEVIQTRSFGYGTYQFTLQDVSPMEPALALSLFTWDESAAGEPSRREVTIEFSRWGDPASKNGQFVVQPYYVPANVSRFEAPAGPITASFRWEPGKLFFQAVSVGRVAREARTIASHLFTSGVPTPGNERVRMHLCGFHYSKVPLQHEAEIVLEKFQYLP
ncbi:hypothetical protein [Edaphobacter aggregans]|uniref:hypothetical protein n=1 Tax=Edaphobacter aggregans TaxID=570835 RepID=UPI00068CCED5|nr:hypothetical protein [Edaphobacter aggregans]